MFLRSTFLVLLPCLLLGACEKATIPTTPEEIATDIRKRMLEAKSGDVIELPAGTFHFDRGLSLYGNNLTLRGAGIDQTILSFKNQLMGAEGVFVSGNNLVIEDFAIEDPKGDALKVIEGKDVIIRRVRAEWTNGPDASNGAYGLYPVKTTNVLVEDCVAIGASDAGIYVGQSDNIIVRRNRAEWNVAGIEIENSVGADVYENIASHNTGGILVFNMPNIPKVGHSTRVYNNQIVDNNTENFAAEGTAVAAVPAGSGLVINSNDRVEIFDNDISGNQTANVLVSSYYSTGYEGKYELAAEYDPYPETIYIYGNRFAGGGDKPDAEELNALRVAIFGENGALPDVVWDGFYNTELASSGKLRATHAICLDNGEASLLNMDGQNDFKAPTVDSEAYRCQHEKLSPIDIGDLGA